MSTNAWVTPNPVDLEAIRRLIAENDRLASEMHAEIDRLRSLLAQQTKSIPCEHLRHRSGCSAWTTDHPQEWRRGDEALCDCGAKELVLASGPPPSSKCVECGAVLNEGEARTFTVCDSCWEKQYLSTSASPPSAGVTPPQEQDCGCRTCEIHVNDYEALAGEYGTLLASYLKLKRSAGVTPRETIYKRALEHIAGNSCCVQCQEAKRVAVKALYDAMREPATDGGVTPRVLELAESIEIEVNVAFEAFGSKFCGYGNRLRSIATQLREAVRESVASVPAAEKEARQ